MKYAILSQFFKINIESIREWLPRFQIVEELETDSDDGSSEPDRNLGEPNEYQEPLQSTTGAEQESNITKLYNLLRESHVSSDKIDSTIPETICCDKLNPTLRPYQNDAVRWMYNRETRPSHYPSEYTTVKCFALPDAQFYFNARTCDLIDSLNGDIRIPSGGILADEMGLGKTVEMLALILTNVRKKRSLCVDEATVPIAAIDEQSTDPGCHSDVDFKCLCTAKSRNELIQCTKCLCFQHRKCVFKYISGQLLPKNKYMCPDCWRFEAPVQSKATFIISPKSIKMQWYSEILKHVNDPSFKVLIYDGLRDNGWISPVDISDYDIVLTDYDILNSEIWYANSSETIKGLRPRSRAIRPISPLQMVGWWRVCLDEAQMVETPSSSCSKMVKMLKSNEQHLEIVDIHLIN